jgi:hypothetical protein
MSTRYISLGGGCNIKYYIKNLNNQKTEFFDYLWNLDEGLYSVTKIIENDFSDFIDNNQFYMNYHPRFKKNILIHKKYTNIGFIHYNIFDVFDKFKRKSTRFLELLNSKEEIIFIYYRHYDEPCNNNYNNNININEKLIYYKNETNNFVKIIQEKYPNLNFKIISIFVEPIEYIQDITDKINNYFEILKNTDKIKFDKIKIDYNLQKESWEKYIV